MNLRELRSMRRERSNIFSLYCSKSSHNKFNEKASSLLFNFGNKRGRIGKKVSKTRVHSSSLVVLPFALWESYMFISAFYFSIIALFRQLRWIFWKFNIKPESCLIQNDTWNNSANAYLKEFLSPLLWIFQFCFCNFLSERKKKDRKTFNYISLSRCTPFYSLHRSFKQGKNATENLVFFFIFKLYFAWWSK